MTSSSIDITINNNGQSFCLIEAQVSFRDLSLAQNNAIADSGVERASPAGCQPVLLHQTALQIFPTAWSPNSRTIGATFRIDGHWEKQIIVIFNNVYLLFSPAIKGGQLVCRWMLAVNPY